MSLIRVNFICIDVIFSNFLNCIVLTAKTDIEIIIFYVIIKDILLWTHQMRLIHSVYYRRAFTKTLNILNYVNHFVKAYIST